MHKHLIIAMIIYSATTAIAAENAATTATNSDKALMIQSAGKFLSGLTREVQQKGDIRIKVEDLYAIKTRGEKLTIVDVRTPQEMAVVGIPGSIKIPLNKIIENLNQIPKDHKVVMVCHSGPRSLIAATTLRILGYDNVYALNGGIHELANVTAKSAPEIVPATKASAPITKTSKPATSNEEEYSELGGDNFSCD